MICCSSCRRNSCSCSEPSFCGDPATCLLKALSSSERSTLYPLTLAITSALVRLGQPVNASTKTATSRNALRLQLSGCIKHDLQQVEFVKQPGAVRRRLGAFWLPGFPAPGFRSSFKSDYFLVSEAATGGPPSPRARFRICRISLSGTAPETRSPLMNRVGVESTP